MPRRNERHIVPGPDGWKVVKPGASRASATAGTQEEATRIAKRILGNDGGGEAVIHRPNGQIRGSDTVDPGNDPFPPRG
ncbi:DUF2188 domain-containing protein [Nocardia sp. NPDC004085]